MVGEIQNQESQLATPREQARIEALSMLEKSREKHAAFFREHAEERDSMAFTCQECDIRTSDGHLMGADIRDIGTISLEKFVRATQQGCDRFEALYRTYKNLVKVDEQKARLKEIDPKTDFSVLSDKYLLNEVKTKALPKSQTFHPKP